MMERAAWVWWGALVAGGLILGLTLNRGFASGADSSMLPVIGSLALLSLVGTFVTGQSMRKALKLAARQRSELAIAQTTIVERGQALDFFADSLDLGIFICDLSANVSYSNRTAREMFGFPNPVGRSILAITLSYDLEQLILRVSETSMPQAQEVTFTGPNERTAMVKAWFNRSADQTFISLLDITNLRRLERVRQDFVANVSHELRTPMAIIRAYAETLLDDADPDATDLQNYLPKMIGEIDRLSGLTSDLLVLSAAEMEQVQKLASDFAEICVNVVHQLSPKAEDKGLQLHYRGPEHLWIEANPAQMTQVILNLIDNAINYTVKGSVLVSLENEGDHLKFRVKDTGIGIATEHSSRIFERFYRVDKGRSRSTGGTGLGLSIVKHIVEAHDGSIAVASILQQGSEFTITLPIGNSSEAAANFGST